MKRPESKAERAIVAAHEAGMHDRRPHPGCRECAKWTEAELREAFGR